jgi:outer membrane protein TolC
MLQYRTFLSFCYNFFRGLSLGKACLLLPLLGSFGGVLHAQFESKKIWSLDEVIRTAQEQSPEYLKVKNQQRSSYWQYVSFKSNNLPQLMLRADAPDLSRTIIPVIQNDGSEAFRERSLSSSSVDLMLSQNILPTGGTFFLTSQLSRIDILGGVSSTSYLSYPLLAGIRQPLFTFNALKWSQRIEPLRYEEAKREFSEKMEEIALQATRQFFDLLLAQSNLQIAIQNEGVLDSIFRRGQGRFSLGKITESDLLQLELNWLNASQSTARARLALAAQSAKMKIFLGINDLQTFQLQVPDAPSSFLIQEEQALTEARKYRSNYLQFERRKLEAARQVAQARGNNGFNMNITASFGLSQSALSFQEVYQNLQDQQRFRLSFEVPILDWGRAKAAIRLSLANQQITEIELGQAQKNFEQDLLFKVQLWNITRQQLQIAEKAQEIARKRYEIAQENYLLGKISIIELSMALQEQDAAFRSYLQNLQDAWVSFFAIRQLTLFDFEQQSPIQYKIQED